MYDFDPMSQMWKVTQPRGWWSQDSGLFVSQAPALSHPTAFLCLGVFDAFWAATPGWLLSGTLCLRLGDSFEPVRGGARPEGHWEKGNLDVVPCLRRMAHFQLLIALPPSQIHSYIPNYDLPPRVPLPLSPGLLLI